MSAVSKKKYPNKKTHKPESEDEDSEHELFYYVNDRIKLMKEVLKVLKPRKIKAMAPDCLKDLDSEELNSMLLEELLGISKKRLKKIFEGENIDDESSSESDEDPIDIISLDDITDDDDIGIIAIVDSTSNADANKKRHKHKKYHTKRIKVEKSVDIKKEKDAESIAENSCRRKKVDKEKKSTSKNTQEGENEKLLSVLELLELQARARAIKSQLIIEAENKQKASLEKEKANVIKASQSNKETDDNESEDDAIIINTPKEEEIIIPSSDSEDNTTSQHEIIEIENSRNNAENVIDVDKDDQERQIEKPKQPKFRIIRNRLIKPSQNLEGLTITVTNDKAKIIPHNTNKNVDKEVKTETLVNVSEFIGPSHGPVEMIHLDTLDVDLNEIILPEQDLCTKKNNFEECMDKVSPEFTKELSQECKSLNKDVQIVSQSLLNPLNNYVSKEKNFIGSCMEIIEKVCSDPKGKYEETKKNETEKSESKEDNRYSDGDDVLLLDALVDE